MMGLLGGEGEPKNGSGMDCGLIFARVRVVEGLAGC